jgi:hypothetical protein
MRKKKESENDAIAIVLCWEGRTKSGWIITQCRRGAAKEGEGEREIREK